MAGFTIPLHRVVEAPPEPAPSVVEQGVPSSLWPDRWPSIALQECVDAVLAAPLDQRDDVKRDLPCSSCPEAGRCLNAKRKEIGPLMYDREILTDPRTSGSSLFPMKLFEPCLRRSEQFVPFWSKPWLQEHEWRILQSWDIAWSEKIGGDWLVCMTGALHIPTGERRILDISRWRAISFDDQINLMESYWKQYGSDAVVIETDAAQKVWASRLSKSTAVPVMQHTAGEKQNLASGVPGLLITLSNRKWVIPAAKNGYHAEHGQAFLSECEAFSWTDKGLEGVGEHDDTVMAWWHLSWLMDRFLGGQGVAEGHVGVQDGRH